MKSYLNRTYVYGWIQRCLHWLIAVSTVLLAITGLWASNAEADGAKAFLWDQHMTCARLLFIGCMGRLTWGIVGPPHARFSSMIHVGLWKQSIKSPQIMSADGPLGHHPQASMSYLFFYVLIVVMIATGYSLAAIKHGFGPLASYLLDDLQYQNSLKEIHEWGWWIAGLFVLIHIAALILHEKYDKIPLAQSMISGFQYRTKRDSNHELDP